MAADPADPLTALAVRFMDDPQGLEDKIVDYLQEASDLGREAALALRAPALETEILESLRAGYLFGNHDEPLDDAGRRLLRVIQQRLHAQDQNHRHEREELSDMREVRAVAPQDDLALHDLSSEKVVALRALATELRHLLYPDEHVDPRKLLNVIADRLDALVSPTSHGQGEPLPPGPQGAGELHPDSHEAKGVR